MGRTREFDIEKALDIAVDLFWRNGYDRTSLSDLTTAIGITPPSFYFAFGSKEKLFQLVIERYVSRQAGFFEEALREPTSQAVFKKLLYGFANAFTDTEHPPGCLGLNSGLPCSMADDPIRNKLAEQRDTSRIQLCKRLKQARADKDLPFDADVDALARYVMMVCWGMAVEAQSGASRNDLYRAADMVLRSLSGRQT